MRPLAFPALLLRLYLRHDIKLLGEEVRCIRSGMSSCEDETPRSQRRLIPHPEDLQYRLCTVVCLFVVLLLCFPLLDCTQTPAYGIQYT